MTISKKQLEEARKEAYSLGHELGRDQGYRVGREEQRKESEHSFNKLREASAINIAGHAAMLAKANASLTYSLSKLMDQVK